MSTVQTSALKLDRPLTQADAKFCSAVMQSCLQVVPTMYETMNGKDFQSDGQEPMADGKLWGAIIGAAATAIPGIISAVSGKDFQTASTEPIAEDKFWTEVSSAAIGILPDLIGAFRRKDFFNGGTANGAPPSHQAQILDNLSAAPISQPVPAPMPDAVETPAPNGTVPDGVEIAVPNGAVPDGVDEKFWGALLAGVIPAVAGAIGH